MTAWVCAPFLGMVLKLTRFKLCPFLSARVTCQKPATVGFLASHDPGRLKNGVLRPRSPNAPTRSAGRCFPHRRALCDPGALSCTQIVSAILPPNLPQKAPTGASVLPGDWDATLGGKAAHRAHTGATSGNGEGRPEWSGLRCERCLLMRLSRKGSPPRLQCSPPYGRAPFARRHPPVGVRR
jgi:hypothetical protein